MNLFLSYLSHLPATHFHALFQALHGLGVVLTLKLETRFYQTARHHTPTFDNQFGLGSQSPCTGFQHPRRGWQSERHAQFTAQDPHHLRIGHIFPPSPSRTKRRSTA